MVTATSMQVAVRRDRRIVLLTLLGVTALAWVYLIVMTLDMGDMLAMAETMTSTRAVSWTAVDSAMTFIMWAAMMMGMMLPSAGPMVLMFTRVNRNQRREDEAVVPTGVFVSGYIAIWLTFSITATLLQWGFQSVGLISPVIGKVNVVVGGLVLVAGGIYQWTPLKHACLRLCQTPLGFLMTQWRDGVGGAFRMGLAHGAYCVGCCWALMLLMFVGGVMNLLWMVLLTVVILAEKITPPGSWLPRIAGTTLIGWGGWVLAHV